MIDRHVLSVQKLLLLPFARLLVARGISADRVTLAAFGAGVAALLALSLGAYGAGLVLILVNRLLDGLDGTVARLERPDRPGAPFSISPATFSSMLLCRWALHSLTPVPTRSPRPC